MLVSCVYSVLVKLQMWAKLYGRPVIVHIVDLASSQHWYCQREGQGAIQLGMSVTVGVVTTKLKTTTMNSLRDSSSWFWI